ncbi:uncharacterized protein VTP21DRAFT_4953 [Calcarisporiella thermophila]|uniref:uncharacterized protein n=1 Tax=Calcarisporiella thermophila TaxID=911321 RepID=UPI0037435670
MKIVNNIYVIGGFAAVAGILFGFDIGSNSGVINTVQYKTYFDHPNETLQGGINSSLSAGCFVGAIISSYPADKIGRKMSIILAAAIFVLGAIIQSACNGHAMLIAGRVLAGLSVGMTSNIVPLYQSEIAPEKVRGRLVSIQQWAITWGICISFWIQYGCSKIDGQAAFRIPYGVQAIPALLLFFGMFFFPRSPRWLMDHDREEEALRVLADIHGEGDVNHPYVQREFSQIKEAIRFDREIAARSYLELLKPGLFKRVFLGVALQAWQQLTGMNIIMFYVVYLFEQAGKAEQEANLVASGVSYVVNVVMTVPAIIYVDKWGRRPTLIAGSAAMATFLFIIGGIMGGIGKPPVDDPNSQTKTTVSGWDMQGNTAATNAIIAMVYFFVASFATTWGPIGWIYPAEIFPMRVRAKATALSTGSNWLFNWILNFFVPILMSKLTYGLYILFGAFNFLMTAHVFFQYPETKGRTLEEMDEIFAAGYSPWRKKKINEATREANLEKGQDTNKEEKEKEEGQPPEVA